MGLGPLGGWNNSFIPSHHHVLSLYYTTLYVQEVGVASNDISSFIPYARPEQAMLREHEFDSLAATIARGLSHRGPSFGFHLSGSLGLEVPWKREQNPSNPATLEPWNHVSLAPGNWGTGNAGNLRNLERWNGAVSTVLATTTQQSAVVRNAFGVSFIFKNFEVLSNHRES